METLTAPAPPIINPSVMEFVSSLTEKRVFRMLENGGSSKVGQFVRYDQETRKMYYINIGKALSNDGQALKEGNMEVLKPISISISRIAKMKAI